MWVFPKIEVFLGDLRGFDLNNIPLFFENHRSWNIQFGLPKENSPTASWGSMQQLGSNNRPSGIPPQMAGRTGRR